MTWNDDSLPSWSLSFAFLLKGGKKAKGGNTVHTSNSRNGATFIMVVILSDLCCSRRDWAAWKEATVLKKGHSLEAIPWSVCERLWEESDSQARLCCGYTFSNTAGGETAWIIHPEDLLDWSGRKSEFPSFAASIHKLYLASVSLVGNSYCSPLALD